MNSLDTELLTDSSITSKARNEPPPQPKIDDDLWKEIQKQLSSSEFITNAGIQEIAHRIVQNRNLGNNTKDKMRRRSSDHISSGANIIPSVSAPSRRSSSFCTPSSSMDSRRCSVGPGLGSSGSDLGIHTRNGSISRRTSTQLTDQLLTNVLNAAMTLHESISSEVSATKELDTADFTALAQACREEAEAIIENSVEDTATDEIDTYDENLIVQFPSNRKRSNRSDVSARTA